MAGTNASCELAEMKAPRKLLVGFLGDMKGLRLSQAVLSCLSASFCSGIIFVPDLELE